jgi:hypothetical protein
VKITLDDCKKIAEDRGGRCLSEAYENSYTELKWECKHGHVWNAPYNRVNSYKSWCPTCYRIKQRGSILSCHQAAEAKGGKCLSTEYINNRNKIKWQCEHGHTWDAPFYSIKKGFWCLDCYRSKKNRKKLKITIEYCRQLAESKKYKCLSTEYKNNRTKIKWQCNKNHIFDMALTNMKDFNQSCPECGGSKKLTIEQCQKVAEAEGGRCLSKGYKNGKTKMLWECKNGHTWRSPFQDVKKGDWCAKCSGTNKATIEDCQEEAKKRGGKCLSEKYKHNKDNLWWECAYGHKWQANLMNVRANKTWCPECQDNFKGTLDECQKMAEAKGGKCLSTEYVGCGEQMWWECSNGHKWSATASSISSSSWCSHIDCVNERRRNSNIKRFGVDHPLKNIDMARQVMRKMNDATIKYNWEDGSEVVCRASYEPKVIDYLNENKIKFKWQTLIFHLKNGKTYTPDLYLVDKDVWVEIKGYFRSNSKEKWEEFLLSYPTAELWDKEKLTEMNILKKGPKRPLKRLA